MLQITARRSPAFSIMAVSPLLKAQCIGSGIITVATFAVSMVLMYAVNAMGLLRVSKEGEMYGLDLHEHGISAYPEYVITTLGSPSGLTTAEK